MEKQITPEDLQRIAELLKAKIGVEIRIMDNEFTKKGVAILIMNTSDYNSFKEVFKPVVDFGELNMNNFLNSNP